MSSEANEFEEDSQPPQYCDDEPLPAPSVDPSSSTSLAPIPPVILNVVPDNPRDDPSLPVYQFHVLVGVRGPSGLLYPRSALVDLVMVLETSQNMNGPKLDLVKKAVEFVIDNLGHSDRLSIVSFATEARRVLPLRRMTRRGQEEAKLAVGSLVAEGWTNIADGLQMGGRILEQRCNQNPVAAIIFLSDGRDTCYCSASPSPFTIPREQSKPNPEYLKLLPASIYPENEGENRGSGQCNTFPVHAFGLGSDHDPTPLYAVSSASGGTYSFVESYAIIREAMASCIGGLLSVVAQEVRLMFTTESPQVQILSISSGPFDNGIHDDGRQGEIQIQDLYCDEVKEFLIMLQVPKNTRTWTSILKATCLYKDAVSKESMRTLPYYTRLPKPVGAESSMRKISIDRKRIQNGVIEGIKMAQQKAEGKDISPAPELLNQMEIQSITAALILQPEDSLCEWLLREILELRRRLRDADEYEKRGRAYALSTLSCLTFQRATTIGDQVNGPAVFEVFATPNMFRMVERSIFAPEPVRRSNIRFVR